MLKIDFDEEDYNEAKILQERERVNPLTDDNLFRAAIYSTISPREHYTKQLDLYFRMIDNKLDNPENILNQDNNFEGIMSKMMIKKRQYVKNLSMAWRDNSIEQLLAYDLSNNQQDEFKLRDSMIKWVNGWNYKCASMFMRMAGYKNIAVLDVHALIYLQQAGYEIKGFVTNRGISSRDYKTHEESFNRIAKEYETNPAFFQYLVWVKSSWRWKNHRSREKQLDLFNPNKLRNLYKP